VSDSRNRRNSQNTLTLIGALGASLAIVFLLVVVTVRPSNLDRNEIEWNSVWSTVSDNSALANPQFAPSDGAWWSNRAEQVGGQYPLWYIGFISPSNGFVSVEQFSGDPEPEIAAQLDDVTSTSATVGGQTWTVIDRRDLEDPGNRSVIYLLSNAGQGSTLMVSGTAPITEIELVALRALESLETTP
jgi:hypothetical protein